MMQRANSNKSARGFTLIEIVMVVAIVSILAAILTPYLIGQLRGVRGEKTKVDLSALKTAMIGDPDTKAEGIRTDYGFIGDMGILPGQGVSPVDEGALTKLVVQDTQPSYLFVSNFKIGGGWHGPYVSGGASNAPLTGEIKFDPFGQPLKYEVRSPAGLGSNDYVARITSKGPDTVLGGGDDIIVEVKKNESFSTVFGYVSDKDTGTPLQHVPVTFYYPDAALTPDPQTGVLIAATTTSDATGFYDFDDIPFGVRSIIMEPKLVYALQSGVTFGGGSDVKFTVTNFSTSAVAIVKVTVYYNITPAAYFGEMVIGGATVFSTTGVDIPRKGSGDPVTVSPVISVAAAPTPFVPLVVQVDSVRTRVKDLTIAASTGGGSVVVEVKNFKNASLGGANPVDVTGVQFTVVFEHADGSISTVTFTPTRA